MTLEILVPRKEDALVIANLHLRAMDSNALLHAQFPNPSSVEYLRGWLERDTIQHICDDDKGILVTRDKQTKDTVSFIKWLVHKGDEDGAEPIADDEPWPETCQRKYLDSYGEITQAVRNKVIGGSSYYHVTFLCTDPGHGGRGAASKLLRDVQDQAAGQNMAIVLESTMDAVAFYEKLGFGISQSLEMMLPPRGSTEPTDLYEEKCMVWRKL